MYLENCDTVFPMKKQTIVVSRNEIGMAGPALRAMIGNVNTTLIDGAMCVMPWNTTWGRSRTLRRSRAVPVLLAVSAVTGTSLDGGQPGSAHLRNRFRNFMNWLNTASIERDLCVTLDHRYRRAHGARCDVDG